MTVALEGGEWSAARPGCTLPPGKTRYPFYKRLGGSQGRSGRAENLVPIRVRSTSRKVTGSIPAGVIGIFHLHKVLPIALWALGSTQPLTEMSTRSISWG